MAKTCMIEREKKRKTLQKRFASKREKLLKIARDRSADPAEIFEANMKLAKLPRNAAKNRQRNRCALTGRPRGVHRKFKLSRNMLREKASRGELPGVVKSSW
ncbi:MAG: 30S ribosomal protein S14 [Rhodospirillales bacterium]|nr:30S ribosomal protein S14 [Alphaproteobacteria bacterium]MCB9986475.1 30S ribosomal protein S14 [Rhodospirillales bacterium]USO06980.1 MAG: 30S ribosomal protein S14 [Rhodospirillales bacterium]